MNTAPFWSAETDDTLVCVQVRPETHDVKTFVFDAPAPRRFAYLPGQFITLSLPIGRGGDVLHRCYTISSSPTRPDRVSITVKRVPGGPVSNWLHDHMRPGMRVQAMGPAGEFTCFTEGDAAQPWKLEGRGPQSYLFISGGSGITPVMSMTRALADLTSDTDIVFVHAARSPADLIFADELLLLARQHPRLRVALVCENLDEQRQWTGYTGRLDQTLLQRIVPNLLEREVYTCGPAPFMAAVHGMLMAAGLSPARYRQESFSFESLAPAEATPKTDSDSQSGSSATASTFRVRLSRLGDEFDCRGDQSLLAGATAAGVRMPSSCSNGLCGTCKVKKLEGEVTMSHKGGIRQREIDQGWILPCCSMPLSNVVLER